MSPRLPATFLALLALGPLAPAVRAQPALHTLLFAQDIQERREALAGELEVLDVQFADDIEALKDDLVAGTATPLETHLAVFALVDALDGGVAAALRTFTTGVEADASEHLQELVTFPNAFAVGDGGLIDDARRKALKLRVRSTTVNFKKVHKLAKVLLKDFDYDLIFDRRGQVIEPMTPSDVQGEVAPVPALVLRMDLLMSGSAKDADDDGVLCVAGTADPDAAATVNVAIAQPGGAAFDVDVAVDAQTGRWQACFPDAAPGDLAEGHWQVTVTQAGVAITDSLALQ
jgi:hypothetical protein